MERRKPHKKLELSAKVMEFVTYIYRLTRGFPRQSAKKKADAKNAEEFGPKSQLRRASVSIPSNISEGLTRWSKKDRLHFLNVAQSSLSEIDGHGLIHSIRTRT